MRNLFYAIILLAMCSLARADVLTINSANFNDGHYYVGPYNSSLNGAPITSYCVDFEHHVNFGQAFEVSVISLANYSGPMLTNYLEAAWITTQMQGVTDVFSLGVMQAGIWLVTTPGTSDPYLTSSGAFLWATAAAQNYQTIDASQFYLAIPTGSVGQAQLFMVPEPGTWCFILVGASLLLFLYLGYRQRAQK